MPQAAVLIVEDNPITRKMLRVSLESAGYRVLEAPDAQTALALADRETLALVVQDLLIPDLDGLELCQRLRASPGGHDIPIIALSGLQSKLDEARALRVGFTDYVFKPVEPSRLIEVIQAYLPTMADAGKPGRQRRILLANDDPVQRRLNQVQLEHLDFKVTLAENGTDALAQAQKVRPDIIVADVHMPGMNGLDLCLAVRTDPHLAEVPVVLTTSSMQYLEEADRRMARDLGANAFLPRTSGFTEVIAAVLESLEVGSPPKPAPEAQTLAPRYFDRLLRQVELQARLNAAMSRRLARDSAWLTIMTKAAAVLTRTSDLQEALDELLGLAIDAGGVSTGAIFLVDAEGQYRLQAQIGCSPVVAERIGRFFGHQELLFRILERGEPAKLPGALGPDAAVAELLGTPETRSVVLAPLVASGKALGVLVMLPGRDDLEDHWLASIGAMASHLAQAVALSRTLEAARDRARLAELSAQVSAALTRGTSPRNTLQRCAEALVNNLDGALARIWTLNAADQTLELQASAGMDTNLDRRHADVPIGQSTIGAIALARKPYLTNTVIGDPQMQDQDWAKREGLVAFAGFPLLVESNLVGVMEVLARKPLPGFVQQALASLADGIAVGVQRRRAEEALHERERQLTAAQQIARLGSWEWDIGTNEARWSDELQSLFGLDRPAGRSSYEAFVQLVHPEDREPLRRAAERAIHERAPYEADFRLIRPDGTVRIFHSIGHLVVDETGTAVRLAGTTQDITERKEAEEEIGAIQSRLQHVIASSATVMYTLDLRDDRYVPSWISENIRQVMGYTVEEAMVEGWWVDKLHPQDRDRVLAEQTALLTRADLTHEYRFRHRDESYRWILDKDRVVRDPMGTPVEVIGTWLDVTERRQLEEHFRQAQKMEAMGRLAGGIAHDFNNILTAILSYAELLAIELGADSPHLEDVAEIQKAADRAADLTKQLLAFSRQQVLQPQVLDLNAIVTDTERMLRRLIGEDVELVTHLAPDLGRVKADPGQLSQVILNLAVNARDAMPEGGRLLLETTNVELDDGYASEHPGAQPGPHVLLAVSDTGTGMDAVIQARIFEPFFTTKPPGKGTGLGLAMVYGIVEQSGGHLWVDSEPGHGTTFKIYLPQVAGERDAAVPAALGITPPPDAPRSTTILLVEDDLTLRNVVRRTLVEHRYIVLAAQNGREALEIAAAYQGPIGLVITDMVMPEMQGAELATRLRKERPDARLLMMSGYTEQAASRQAIVETGSHFLAKPFTPSRLIEKVQEVLDGR